MSGIYALLILSSVLAVGTALKCYACTSTSSWDDCKENSRKGSCLDPYLTKCVKAKVTVKHLGQTSYGYLKGCAKTCNAYDVPACTKSGVSCEIYCCTGDYCNAGSSLVASIIIPAICVLISAVFTKMH